MTERKRPSHLRIQDMRWPDPDDPNEVQWRLRYAPEHLTEADQLFAASVLSAYQHLINLPSRPRQQRAMQIRAARDTARETYPEEDER